MSKHVPHSTGKDAMSFKIRVQTRYIPSPCDQWEVLSRSLNRFQTKAAEMQGQTKNFAVYIIISNADS